MRAYLRTISTSRQYRLVSLLSLALMVCCPSAGSALPSFREFFPELTSGWVRLINMGTDFAEATVTSQGTTIRAIGHSPDNRFFGGTSFTLRWELMDVFSASVIDAGQVYPHCGNRQIVPCADSKLFTLSMSAPPPPPPLTPGEFLTTVPGTFSLDLSARVFFSTSFLNGPLLLFHFETPGRPASITLEWHPGVDRWDFVSGVAEFQPTPEPTTLLLFGTTAAGLGLARWRQRRLRERTHAA